MISTNWRLSNELVVGASDFPNGSKSFAGIILLIGTFESALHQNPCKKVNKVKTTIENCRVILSYHTPTAVTAMLTTPSNDFHLMLFRDKQERTLAGPLISLPRLSTLHLVEADKK